jgi:hypothetical protein
MLESLFTVVTTVRQPTPAVQRLKKALDTVGGQLVIVGDSKGPASFPMEGVIFSSLADQEKLPFRLSRLLPTGHYARKNLGYLMAIQAGASCIYETDDDNAPMKGWGARLETVPARRAKGTPWVNAYRYFTEEKIWPRGFPLRLVRDDSSPGVEAGGEISIVVAPIQQGLADLFELPAFHGILVQTYSQYPVRASTSRIFCSGSLTAIRIYALPSLNFEEQSFIYMFHWLRR